MRTVLIVEDDEQVRSHYRSSLERAGLMVREAATSDAVRRLHAEAPDIVITDLALPAVDEICRTIRRDPDLSSTRIVVTARMAGGSVRGRLSGLAPDAVLPAPVDGAQLAVTCASVCTGGEAPVSGRCRGASRALAGRISSLAARA